jgi:hypothetical protein
MSTLRLPQCEQRNHSLQSGTVVAGAISLGWPRVGLDLVAAPHDQPRCTAAGLPSVIAGPAIELQRPMPVPARNARTSWQIGAVVHLRGSQTIWSVQWKSPTRPSCRSRAIFSSGPKGVTAKAVPHQNNSARPILPRIARCAELHDRLRDDRHRHFHAQGIADQPIHLAGILDTPTAGN